MKIAVAVLACAAGASAFAPAAKSNKVVALNSVWDDYVGGVDLRGQKFEFDPVRITTIQSNGPVANTILWLCRWRCTIFLVSLTLLHTHTHMHIPHSYS